MIFVLLTRHFFSVMGFAVVQFGGQHPGGVGVPAVGMAFPGYVGQPGNSEMTWWGYLYLIWC